MDRADWTPEQFEQEARRQGWNPDADIPDDRKVDAKTFVERGDQFLSRQKDRAETAERRLAELERTTQDFRQYMTQARERDKQQFEEQLTQLKQKRAQALSDGDGETFNIVDEQIDQMQRRPQEVVNSAPDFTDRFLQRNSWYEKDPVLTTFADGLAGRVQAEGFAYGTEAYINEIDRRVRDAFPNRFDNPARSSDAVEGVGGDRTVSTGNARTYENLPPDARAACDKFVRDIPGYTVKQYLADYEWE